MEKNIQIPVLPSFSLEDRLAAYENIELTEDEKKQALLLAKKHKQGVLNAQAHWEKVNKKVEYPVYDAESFYQIICNKAKKEIPDFIFDDFNKRILFDLCLYFTDDERFDKIPGCNLKKGLLLFGNVGCGKTTLMKLFSENQRASYLVVSCRKVAAVFTDSDKGGYKAIEQYCWLHSSMLIGLPFGHTQTLGFCFDDLGTEDSKKYFGNQSNVMAEVLLNRYDNQNELRGKTHITTNLIPDEIENIYGTRLRSRMREMFNMIEFNQKAPDRRK